MRTSIQPYNYGVNGRGILLALDEPRTVTNMTVKVGDRFVPDGLWRNLDHALENSIECIEVTPAGFRFRRDNHAEPLFLTPDAFANSHWLSSLVN